MPPPFLLRSKTSWWLNQPILKKYARQIGSFPQGSGWKLTIFELPPPRKYVILYTVGKSREIVPVSWLELVHLGRKKKTTFGLLEGQNLRIFQTCSSDSRPSRPWAFLDSLHTSKVWPFAKLDLAIHQVSWRSWRCLLDNLCWSIWFGWIWFYHKKPYLGCRKW